MYLDEFPVYKEQVMEDLLTEEKIVKLIDAEVPLDQAKKLVYTRVFPYEYVPGTAEHGITYICCDVDLVKEETQNKTTYSPTLYIWVFTHRSLLRLPEGGVRTDALVCEIARKLNGSREYGIGELELVAVKRFAPMTDYQGKAMIFKAREWNRPHPTGKAIPGNRRAGKL